MPSKTDADYLRDMLRYAENAIEITAGKSSDDIAGDRVLSFAIQHCLLIIEEAASHVSEETRKRFPSIPWKQIVGMRNWIVHGYERLDQEVIWKTTTEDLPVLVESILDQLPPEQT